MNVNSYKCCKPLRSESKQVASLSGTLQVVSEGNRLQLLCILRQGEHCVCELTGHVEMSQSLISHHLKDLKDAGVVADEKRGVRVYYSLTAKGRKITDLLFQLPEEVKR